MRRRKAGGSGLIRAAVALLLTLAAAAAAAQPADEATCAGCHPAETAAWRASHHALAETTAATGDFAGTTFTDTAGRITRFLQDNDRPIVETDGRRFEIAGTIGAYPLRQLLLRTEHGRIQAFDIAWDARPHAEGGQHWFALGEAQKPGDPAHWTGAGLRWNFACAPCHVTGLAKNFDPATQTYATRFDVAGVSCAACHGDATRHLTWARSGSPADPHHGFALGLTESARPTFVMGDGPIAHRALAGLPGVNDLCFGCHARREALLPDQPPPGTPFLDADLPALLTPDLVFPDGQNRAEMFEWASFSQSAMARAGVACVNCHDPHGLSVADRGNGLCAQCHAPAHFDTPAHTHHSGTGAETRCVTCHMPARVYMGLQTRHDHGFRVPHPDPAQAGTPDPCTGCHTGRSAAWAQAALRAWGVPDAPPHPSAIARASLAARSSDEAEIRAASTDPDPLVRLGAAEGLANLPPETRPQFAPLAADPARAVRVEAANALAGAPLSPALRDAIGDFIAAQQASADRPESQAALGDFWARAGEAAKSAAAFHAALAIEPDFLPALLGLGDLARATGDEAASERWLRQALAAAPDDPAALDALALQRVRAGDSAEAGRLIVKAASIAPQNAEAARLLQAWRAQTQAGPAAAR